LHFSTLAALPLVAASCGRFVDEYFQEECGDNRYYSDDTANCVNIGPGEPVRC
jgi:hypothetical protein